MDYLALGFGNLTSIITAVDVAALGRTVTLACLYNPGGEDRPYAITFHGCSQIRWEPLDEGQGSRDVAELLGIELGAAQHQRPALISSDTFELAVWYHHYEVHMNDNIPQKVIDAVRAAWHIEGDLTSQVNIEELTHDWVVYQLDPPRTSATQPDPDAHEQIALEHPAPFRLENLGMLRLVVPKNGKNWFLLTSGEGADEESGVSGEYDVMVENCPNPSQEAAAVLAAHLYRPNPESIRALENDDLEAFLSLDQVVYLSVEDALRALQHTPFRLGIYAISEPIPLIKALRPHQVRISLVRPNDSGGYHSDNVV